MLNKIKSLGIIFLIILMVSFISIGCQNDDTDTNDDANEGMDNEDNKDQDMTDGDMTDEDMDSEMKDEEDSNMTNEDEDMDMNNESLANSIVEMDGINDATVVTMDEIALVGVDFNGEDKISDDMKKDIESKIKEKSDKISKVYISNEPDMYDRINTISNDVRNGNPIDDFSDDISEMIENITPNGK
ncbi:YhcN/YlaJ family sporulation lipoprotein [Senegalia sp. (in: firmicutes)]|uniref:YhcN/YlaJ family sporulation lipoprotein n=2 Tax=Senegalia sp. (in: firmicutes) TaxID=1924098 RepID=UPI003F9B2341